MVDVPVDGVVVVPPVPPVTCWTKGSFLLKTADQIVELLLVDTLVEGVVEVPEGWPVAACVVVLPGAVLVAVF